MCLSFFLFGSSVVLFNTILLPFILQDLDGIEIGHRFCKPEPIRRGPDEFFQREPFGTDKGKEVFGDDIFLIRLVPDDSPIFG